MSSTNGCATVELDGNNSLESLSVVRCLSLLTLRILKIDTIHFKIYAIFQYYLNWNVLFNIVVEFCFAKYTYPLLIFL